MGCGKVEIKIEFDCCMLMTFFTEIFLPLILFVYTLKTCFRVHLISMIITCYVPSFCEYRVTVVVFYLYIIAFSC